MEGVVDGACVYPTSCRWYVLPQQRQLVEQLLNCGGTASIEPNLQLLRSRNDHVKPLSPYEIIVAEALITNANDHADFCMENVIVIGDATMPQFNSSRLAAAILTVALMDDVNIVERDAVEQLQDPWVAW